MGNVHEGIVQSKLVIIIKIDNQSYTSRHGITLNKSKLGLEQKKKKRKGLRGNSETVEQELKMQ